jgi:hypothetical protein
MGTQLNHGALEKEFTSGGAENFLMRNCCQEKFRTIIFNGNLPVLLFRKSALQAVLFALMWRN